MGDAGDHRDPALMNDALANDRTFLAWLRTGIALFGLGVVIAKVALIVNTNNAKVQHQTFYAVVGIVSVCCGGALVTVGYLQHRRVRSLLAPEATPGRLHWPLATTLAALAGAVVLAVLLAVSA
jgi:putative membrane protein